MFQSKENRLLCSINILWVLCEVKAGWLRNETTYKKLFQNGKEATEIYIWLPYVIYLGTY